MEKKYSTSIKMAYRDNFFYEYVNIRVDQGMTKYDAIMHYLNNAQIPYEYTTMKCIDDEYNHSLTIIIPINNLNVILDPGINLTHII